MKNLDVEILEETKGKIGMLKNGFMNYQNMDKIIGLGKFTKKINKQAKAQPNRVAGHG